MAVLRLQILPVVEPLLHLPMPADRPLRILYVDDELVNLKLVKAVIAFVLKL